MKKLSTFITIFILLLSLLTISVQASDTPAQPPALNSESAVLMDAKTGQVLFEKNMNKTEYPASITKIMTILLGVEKGNLQDTITMSDSAVFSVPRNSSHIALTPGEQITLEQALYAALLVSANDACNGIAEYVSGNINDFAKLMTKRAKELGALNTNFVNANGLWDESHYTTAYDMAMITKGALNNQTFKKIFSTKTYTLNPTNKQPESRNFTTEQKMLLNTKFQYDGTEGGKTGWTEKAKHTMVTVAKRNNRELIAVVMNSTNGNDKFNDTIALFNYGFDNFKDVMIKKEKIQSKSVPLIKSKKLAGNVEVTANKDISLLLYNGIDESDIKISYNIPSKFKETVGEPTVDFSLSKDSDFMYNKLGSLKLNTMLIKQTEIKATTKHSTLYFVFIILISIIIAILLFILIVFIDVSLKKRKRKKLKSLKEKNNINIKSNKK